MLKKEHYIVAIGASAGGLEAIHSFFDHMPGNSNLSFVVIQHLSPDYKSLLVELVARHTNMKVYEAENNIVVRKNCIYVIPNNKLISLKDSRLILSDKLQMKVPNNAVDVFMHTLAKEKKSKAIAVILSGTGTDGTKGIASIKEEGGLVIAQEPASSKFDGMPNSAINSGNVDYILPANEIPQQIINYLSEGDWNDDDTLDDQTLKKIFTQVEQQAGLDFHYYKTPTITRRILHRMRKVGRETIASYHEYLTDNAEECRQLGKELLINVTRFFRDTEAFDTMKADILPRIVEQKGADDQIKAWICACSTGEEAYSLAILLDETLREKNANGISVKLFATDIERSNIEIASRGHYPTSIEADISPERLKKYFIKQEDGYTICPKIRKQIVFAVHDVIKDPPFIKNDLVSCRNMLIYMNSALQQRVYSVLLYSLSRYGYLFLGTTENANSIKAHLTELDAKWKIYQKISEARLAPSLPALAERSKASNGQAPKPALESAKKPRSMWDHVKETLIDDFNFAAFYIDRHFDIKEAEGQYDQLLSLPKKALKLNLLRMLPANISSLLVGEIKKAWSTNDKKHIKNLHFNQDNKSFALQVVVKPESASQAHTLVAFHFMEMKEPVVIEEHFQIGSRGTDSDYVLSLEEELNETKSTLQTTIEDLETTNEELQSTNEELLSANEELQSSNEELQSLNEELHTLNTEHQLKIKELIELNDDLNNYFRSSNIGQIFLDRNLAIRKFNPASARMINFIETDIGRPITHISTNIKYNGLIRDIESVLKTNETIELEVELLSGMNLLLRIMPYINQEKQTSGVIISFIDITTITNLNNIIRGVFNASLNYIYALEAVRDAKKQIADFAIVTANHAGARLLNSDVDNLSGALLRQDLKSPVFDALHRQLAQVVDKDATLHTDFFLEEKRMWLEVSAVKMTDGLVVTFNDITQKKAAEERLKKNYAELISAKETLKKLNEELEVKVAQRTQLLSDSEERFRLVARATNDAIWDWDLVNNRLWFSDTFYHKFGYDKTSGFSRQLWLENIHPTDQPMVDKGIYEAINSGKTQWTSEYRFKKADGHTAHILDRGYIMQDDNRTPYRMVGSMLDLTDLKKAEQEVASNVAQRKFLAESMPLIVWTANEKGKVDFVNNQFEAYTGLSYADALGDGWKNVIHGQDLVQLNNQWQLAIADKRDFQLEIRIRMHNSAFHWNLLRGKARNDEFQHGISWVVTATDIHEQKQLHEVLEQKVSERTQELLEINYALEVSNHDLQQFASVASHDLQEPLRKIHLYTQLIHERHGTNLGSGSKYLQKILQSSARMKSVINNILNYSKLSADNGGYEPTNINGIINEILDDLEILIQEKNAVIKVSPIPEIEAVPGLIRQVFQNMISNALKFTKPDVTPQITITGEKVDKKSTEAEASPNGAYCRIIIADNGIGFNKKFAHNIFVLFHRLHSKDSYEGTGIGLAIAKKIVEKHQGVISATGKEGEGATFVIVLPIHQ